MRCPDCGESLSEVNLSSTDSAYRCLRCGGFWLDSWTVNRLTGEALVTFLPVVPIGYVKTGNGTCPLDGLPLKKYIGESVPSNILVKRCDRCGKWWFSGNSLFDYKPAQEAKIKYFNLWGIASDVSSLLLPIAVIIVLAVGIWIGLDLIKSQQREIIKAVEKVVR